MTLCNEPVDFYLFMRENIIYSTLLMKSNFDQIYILHLTNSKDIAAMVNKLFKKA
jgi:hypothetical protein